MFGNILPIAAALSAFDLGTANLDFCDSWGETAEGEDDNWNFDWDLSSTQSTHTDTSNASFHTHANRVWSATTYNLQSTKTRPMSEVLRRIHTDIIMLQATGSRWNGFTMRGKQQQFTIKKLDDYWIIEWPFLPSSSYSNYSWGVAIALKRQVIPRSSLMRVYSPGEDIQGKAGGVRIRMKSGIDFTIGVAYLSPLGSFGSNIINESIWNWISDLIHSLPQRTLPVLGMDANARLGPRLTTTVDGYWQIGPYSKQRENTAGRRFRSFVAETGLSVLNTIIKNASGFTWYNSRGMASRVDYILTSPTAIDYTVDLYVARALGFCLQIQDIARLSDHCPLIWRFRHPNPFPGQKSKVRWTREMTDYLCHNPGMARGIFHTLDEWASSEQTTEAVAHCTHTEDVDTLWRLIHGGVQVIFDRFGLFRNLSKFPSEDFEISLLLSKRFELKQYLYTRTMEHDAAGPIKRTQRLLNAIKHRIKTAKELWWQNRQQVLSSEIVEYSKKGSWRRVWSAVRRLSQSLLGPKGRLLHQAPSFYPSAGEWSELLSKTGHEGGCCGVEVWKGKASEVDTLLRSGQLLLAPSSQKVHLLTDIDYNRPSFADAKRQGLEDFSGLLSQLTRHTNGFATPIWSLPREFWRLCLCGMWPEMQGQPQPPSSFRYIVQALCILVRVAGKLPVHWLISQGQPIPKYNNKTGARAFRLVHLIESLAKAWSASIWRKYKFNLGHCAFGFIKGRRREEAILVLRILLWRLASAGFDVLGFFCDVSNAFPSLGWRPLERTAYRRMSEGDKHMMILRHRNGLVFVLDFQGKAVIIRILSGTKQGESCAPQEFASTFDKMTRVFNQNHFSLLDQMCFVTRDPWCNVPVCLNSVLFADDFSKLVVVPSDYSPFITLQNINNEFSRFLQKGQMDSSDDKLKALFACNSNKRKLAFLEEKKKHSLGKYFKSSVNKLGCLISSQVRDRDHGSKIEVSKRIQDANLHWRSFWRFWTRMDIELKIRVHVYRAVCFSTLTQGLIAAVLSKQQVRRLEIWHVNKLRLMCLGDAVGYTNSQVRQHCNSPSVFCALLKSRLQHYQNIARQPQHHVALIAALGGNLKVGPPQLIGSIPRDNANPWLLQMWEDLAIAGTFSARLSDDLRRFGWKGLPNSEVFMNFQLRRLPKFSTPCDSGNRIQHQDIIRCHCGQLCHGPQGYALHNVLRHDTQPEYFRFVVGNVCPCCRAVFASKRSVRLHLARRFPDKCLKRDHLNPREFTIHKPRNFHCSSCHFQCIDWNTLLKHLAQHIEEIRTSFRARSSSTDSHAGVDQEHPTNRRSQRRR